MGKDSSIEWTDHTFNTHWGCNEVSLGCDNCYAKTLAARFGFEVWGAPAHSERRTFGDAHWREPLHWNAAAEKAGKRARVFCNSMSDVFEFHPQLPPVRERLWELIGRTPSLFWLLLTKRPEQINRMVPQAWLEGQWPDNVGVGTSAEDQRWFDRRVAWLRRVPAPLRFLSVEPLLGPIDMNPLFGLKPGNDWRECLCSEIAPEDCPCMVCDVRRFYGEQSGIDWVIVGGESGAHARPMHPDWARSLRDACVGAGVPFFFKQWGEWRPSDLLVPAGEKGTPRALVAEGTDQEMIVYRVGKHRAGRLLDGVEWSQFPEAGA